MFANKIHEEAHKAFEQGDYSNAVIGYTNALKESENDCTILSDRAVAYLHLNENKKCIADFDLAVQLQPEYSFRYASRAYAKKHFNDIDGAIEDYETAINLDPTDEISQNNLGVLLEEMGAQAQADTHFEKSDELRKKKENESPVVEESIQTTEEVSEKNNPEFKPMSDEEFATKKKEFKKIFSSKQQLTEFLSFIKNGFKIK